MDSIDNDIMQQASEHVIHANRLADIHTITLELNGGHGGADLVIQGFVKQDDTVRVGEDADKFYAPLEEFERKFEVH